MGIRTEWQTRFHRWLCRHGAHDWVNIEIARLGEDRRQYARCSRCGERIEGQVL